MQKENRISNEQIKALVVTNIIGIGILSLPSDVAMILKNDGWIAILLGGLITIPLIIIIDRIFKLYPGKNFFQIGKDIMNPMVFNLFLIIIFIYTLILLAYTNRIFAEVIKAYLLETTPTEVIILTMLLAVVYVSGSSLEVIGRMAVMIYPIIIGYIIFLVVVNLPNMDFTNIYPIFDIDYKAIPKGIVTAFFSYAGYEILLLALNSSEDNKKSLKYSIRGLFIVIGVYLIIFFITLSQFGVYQLEREIWPTIAIVKEVDLPGYFLENLDGIVMATWVMVVYGTMGPFLHFSGSILSEIFKTKTHSMFILPLIPLIYILALLPDNLVNTDKTMGKVLNYFALISIVIIPIILLLLAYVKRRKRA